MKKQFLLFICIMCCAMATHAQTKTPNFTLKELIALASNDDEYFDTYATGKGFEFLEAKNEGGCETVKYGYDVVKNRQFSSQLLSNYNCETFLTCGWFPGN